jgi:hypothetical protein
MLLGREAIFVREVGRVEEGKAYRHGDFQVPGEVYTPRLPRYQVPYYSGLLGWCRYVSNTVRKNQWSMHAHKELCTVSKFPFTLYSWLNSASL